MPAYFTVKLNTAYITDSNLLKIVKYVSRHVSVFETDLKLTDIHLQASNEVNKVFVRFTIRKSVIRGMFKFRLNKILIKITDGDFETLDVPNGHYYGEDTTKMITTLHKGQLSFSYDPSKSSFRSITDIKYVLMQLDTHVTKDTNSLNLTDIFIVGESNTVRKVYRWLSHALQSEGVKTFNETVWKELLSRIPRWLHNERRFRVVGILNKRPVDLRTLEYLQSTNNAEEDLIGAMTLGLEYKTVMSGLQVFTNQSEYTLKSINLLVGANAERLLN